MTYMVELRYIGGDRTELVRAMQAWLEQNHIDVAEFHHTTAAPGLAFRVGFRNGDHATAFAQAFRGCVEGTGPQQSGESWTTPPPPRSGEPLPPSVPGSRKKHSRSARPKVVS